MRRFIPILCAFLLVSFLITVPGADAQEGWGLKDAIGDSAESKYMPENVAKSQSSDDAKVTNNVAGIIRSTTNALTMVVATIAILFTIVNAIILTTSGGGERLNKAKKGLLWSIAGLMLVIFAYIIVKTTIALVYVD